MRKTPDESIKIACESCGGEFSCGAKAGACWCFTVDLAAETLAALRDDFQRCLCEKCLRGASDLLPKTNKYL